MQIDTANKAQRRSNVVVSTFALTAGFGALIGASCCVLPLLLTIVGAGGAWMSVLGVFVAYQTYIFLMAAVLITIGWVIALRRKAEPRIVAVLVLSTVMAVGAVWISANDRQLSQYLITVWRSS